MSKLDELKLYLRDLNYPGIKIMQDNEVAEIFGKDNRLYFLIWFVQQWDGNIVLPTDEKSKLNMMADFLCDNGFCPSQKSIKFVQDNLELKPNEQLEIMYRMLYNLRFLKLSKGSSEMHNIHSAEKIRILSELDINIFPEFGRIQTRKPHERIQKLNEIQQEIEQLQKEIKCSNIEACNEESLNLHDLNDSDSLVKQVSVLMNNLSFLLKEQKKEDKGVFDQHFEAIVKSSNKSIFDVLKLYENRKTICDFRMNFENLAENNYINDIMKKISVFSQEILPID